MQKYKCRTSASKQHCNKNLSKPTHWEQLESLDKTLLIFLLLLLKYSCLHHHFPLPHPPPPPTCNPTPIWLFLWILYTCSLMNLPLLSLISYPPPSSPLVTVGLFFISMPQVIFCLLVCLDDEVILIGEIIWYLSFTVWLISLSIMLSSSIHAVAKGRSSFFLSAA